LKAAVEAHKAKAGAIVVLDVRTGEVLALANLPTYNPNNRGKLTGAQLRNRVMTDLFEPGSTAKPLTVALAMEAGKVSPATVIQTAPGSLTIANRTIRDAHPGGAMSVAQVIQKSSNVGTAKIALSLSREEMWDMFRRVGFGAGPALGFPGEAQGRLREWKSWRPIEQATMSYGYGLSVSLIQLARAYSVFARDGELVPLTLTRTDMPVAGKQVISADTARAMRAMLEMAVQPGGTAPRARVMGYRVGGKTGTAHKQENGGYAAHKYVSSFVGFGPISDPRIVIAVMIDEPSAGQHYGGAVAAPVFSQVMQGALRRLGVTPDAPMQPIELPGEGEEVKEST
jgi:cell division protein FtsI (penicillin-binding protein 3)